MSDRPSDAASPGSIAPSSAETLADLLEVQAGSVVSRTLDKGKAGTLTLFAFDAGEGLSEHSAPYDAWVQVLEGEVALTIGGQDVRAIAGQIVRMPADVPHALEAVAPLKMLLTMFKA